MYSLGSTRSGIRWWWPRVVSPRPAYQPIAAQIVLVNTPGVTTSDLSFFTYRNRAGPSIPSRATPPTPPARTSRTRPTARLGRPEAPGDPGRRRHGGHHPALGVPLAGSFTARYAVDVDDPLACRAVVLEDDTGPGGCGLRPVRPDLPPRSDDERRARPPGQRRPSPRSGCWWPPPTPTPPPAPPGSWAPRPPRPTWRPLPAYRQRHRPRRRLRPARVAWGSGQETGVSFNRRFKMRDGTVRMNPGRRNPDALAPVAPIDPEVGVLWVEGTDGDPIACLTSFSLHYVGTGHADHVSADYFGAYARWMQRLFGPQLVPCCSTGPAGTSTTWTCTTPAAFRTPPGGARRRSWPGETCAWCSGPPPFPEDLGAGDGPAPLRPQGRHPRRPGDRPPASWPSPDLPPARRVAPLAWTPVAPLLGGGLYPAGQRPAAVRRGDAPPGRPPGADGDGGAGPPRGEQACVALPGEVFVELGLQLKGRARPRSATGPP